MPITWEVTYSEAKLIVAITDRAEAIARLFPEIPFERRYCHMDVQATHANGCPLQLAELLNSDNTDFIHDVWGIMRHIDRRTGKLAGFFEPRYSKAMQEAAL